MGVWAVMWKTNCKWTLLVAVADTAAPDEWSVLCSGHNKGVVWTVVLSLCACCCICLQLRVVYVKQRRAYVITWLSLPTFVLTKWSSVCLGIQESTVLVSTTGEGRLDEYDLWALFWWLQHINLWSNTVWRMILRRSVTLTMMICWSTWSRVM